MSIYNHLFLLFIIIIFKHQCNCLDKFDNESPDSENSKLLNLIAQSNYQQQRLKRAATSDPDKKWPHGIIPYEIMPDTFSEKQLSVFKSAMKHWQNKTCIKFVERDPTKHENYILITEKPCGCCSLVGRIGGVQDVSLSITCAKFGIVVHELGHIIGFWHEHTRPDRDRNVAIVYRNIHHLKLHNFDKHNKSEIDSLGSPYDFDSIMHYSRNTYAKNEFLNTIVPKDPTGKTFEIGQRNALSKQDIIQTNLLYKCPTNGQTIQEPNKGTIELNEDLEMNKAEKDEYYYEWRIYATSLSEHIKIKFKEIILRYFEDFNCDENYLLILDGYQLDSPILKKFCINTIPSLPIEINSKTNRVLMIYKKSKKNSSGNLNFKIDYEFICGGNLISKNGILQSANYPLEYLPMSNCEWSIKVNPNYKIILNFIRFDLESSLGCTRDYLEIRNGLDENGSLIGRYCGPIFRIPKQIQSISNELFIKFVSDEEISKTGFNITYSVDIDECEQNLHDCDQICINELNGFRCDCLPGYELSRDGKTCLNSCGGTIDVINEEGIENLHKLTSPDYPNNYKSGLNCIWELRAPPNYNLYINFTDFDLEDNTNCASDVLSLKSKFIENNSLMNHGRYCGQRIPDPILSKNNIVLIDFKTDKSDTRKGFSLDYMLDKNECRIDNGGCEHFCENKFGSYECKCQKGYLLESNKHKCKLEPCNQHFTLSKGSFRSINFQNSNITNVDCVYWIETLPGFLIKIKISFNNFVSIKSNCLTSNLILYDGLISNDKILYKFRDNNNKYKIILSNKNSLFITYYSTPECFHPGFSLTYVSVCGGKYIATNERQYIYSHLEFGNSTYKPSTDCKWLIKSKNSKYIRIRFLVFDLEDGDNGKCVFDNLMIYDGNHEDSRKLIATFCGSKLPNQTISLSSSLLIKFTTDDTRNRNGFTFIYDEVDGNDLIEYSV